MAKVELHQVSKVYSGGVKAVDAIDLTIADREFVVLVGPSGCGKTTTLRMVAGLEEITGGIIRIGDRVVNDVAPKDRDIAMVFQNYALYPHMTVYKNMAFGLKLRGFPREQIRQRVGHAAKILEIEHLLDRKPKQLSGGQRQRVAVGRAIVREPAAFLFDEPLSNLDAKLRVTTRAELKRLHQRLKTTTIYVTHDQEEAMTLGDRIVVMKDGKIQQSDTPLGTYNHPTNRFVAGFIGMPPMNFFDGVIQQVDGQMSFVEGRLGNGSGGVSDELTLPPGGFTLAVPAERQAALSGKIGVHVVLGVRPEHVHLRPVDANAQAARIDAGKMDVGKVDAGKIDVAVNVIEPLGNTMDIYLSTPAGSNMIGRVEAESGLTSHTNISVFVDGRRIHFFEPGETGMNLSLENVSAVCEPAHAAF